MCTIISMVNGANILFLVPSPSPSHWILLQVFVKELIKRGHSVTAVTNRAINNFNSTNYTELLIDPPLDMDKHCEYWNNLNQSSKLRTTHDIL